MGIGHVAPFSLTTFLPPARPAPAPDVKGAWLQGDARDSQGAALSSFPLPPGIRTAMTLHPSPQYSCRVNSAHISQSRPEFGLDLSHFQAKLLSCSLLARQRETATRCFKEGSQTCVSLNSRLESNKEAEESNRFPSEMLAEPPCPRTGSSRPTRSELHGLGERRRDGTAVVPRRARI